MIFYTADCAKKPGQKALGERSAEQRTRLVAKFKGQSYLWAALLAVAGLAACQTTSETAGGPVTAPPAASTPAAPSAPKRDDVKFTAIQTGDVLNREKTTVTSLLGKPELMRQEGTAEFWQYRTDACVLLLFFYPDSKGKLVVTEMEPVARAQLGGRPVGTPMDKTACVNSVVRAKAIAEAATS